MAQHLESRREVLRQMRPQDPRSTVTEQKLRLAALQARLQERLRRLLEERKHQIAQKQGQLEALSPTEVLDRGYSVTLKQGQMVIDAATLKKGDQLTIQLASGKAIVRVQEVIKEGEQEQLELRLGD